MSENFTLFCYNKIGDNKMKNDFKLYILSGKARHGKTTTANLIKEVYAKYGKNVVITSFAKYIKMYAKEITDWDGSEETKPRKLLQTLGTEVIRGKLGKEDFFVKRIDEDLDVYKLFTDIVVIEDARIPLEIDYFVNKYKNSVKTIHIERGDYRSCLTPLEQSHETEKGLDNYDAYIYTIVNDGTIDDLKSRVSSLIERIEEK